MDESELSYHLGSKLALAHRRSLRPGPFAAGALLILLAQVRSMPLFLTLFTLVGMALAYLPAFWAIPTERLTHSAAPVVGMINAVGSIAGFAGRLSL